MKSHLKVRIIDLYKWFFVWGFFYCTFLSSLTQFVLPRAKLQMAINIIALVAFVFMYGMKKQQTKSVFFDILLIAMIFIVGMGYVRVGDYEYWAQARYIVILMFCLIAMRREDWSDYFVHMILVFGLFYAVTTIWLSIDAGTYQNIVVNWYPNTRATLLKLYSEHKFAGITDHYSTNGMVLANGLIVAWAYMIVGMQNREKKRRKYIIYFAIIIIALFLTAKRAHLLFGLLAIYIGYYICTSKEKNHGMKMFMLIIVSFFLLVVAYIAVPQVRNVLERFLNTTDDTNIDSRLIFWQAALNQFQSHKLFGIGWFGFRNNVASSVNYSGHCHNVYIQLLCENGIIGFSIFVLWFIGSLVNTIVLVRDCFSSISDRNIRIKLMFSLCYQIYFLMYCYTGNPLFDSFQYPVYFVACIISMFYSHNKSYMCLRKEEN